MKDEIKEILEYLKDIKTYSRDEIGYYKDLYGSQIDVLLDYITNLQTIEQQYSAILSENAELENKITNLQEELKSANESIIWWNNRFNAVEKENERLKDIIKEAINYIDDNTYYKDHKGHINIDDVYIILQGENKDDN